MINIKRTLDPKRYQRPVIKFTKKFIESLYFESSMQDRLKKIASHYKVSIEEAYEIDFLWLIPARTA